MHHGRNILYCPIRMCGRPGLVYSIQWFEQFAENVMLGLQFCGLIYEGQPMDMCKTLPSGGVDVLDVSVYWLLPSGETTCCSARHLHKDRHRVGVQLDSQDDYEAMGQALGLTYLGGRCDVTDFVQDPGTLRKRRWASLPWMMPTSSMDAFVVELKVIKV